MHRQVGSSLFERHLKFFDEQALSADLAQGAVKDLVAAGGHAQQADLVAKPDQQVPHMLGLP